jgi:hypothetical protein
MYEFAFTCRPSPVDQHLGEVEQVGGAADAAEPQATPMLPSDTSSLPGEPGVGDGQLGGAHRERDTRPMPRTCLRVHCSGTSKPSQGAARRVPMST